MVPSKPKPGRVLISTGQYEIFLDLVLMMHLLKWENEKGAGGISSSVLAQPRVPPKHGASPTRDEPSVHLTTHCSVGKAGIL